MTRRLLLVLIPLALGGCAGNQTPLDPAGIQAERIHGLWHLFLWVCVAIYVVVMAVLIVGVVRRRSVGTPESPTPSPTATEEMPRTMIVIGAVSLTTVILFVFLFADFATGRSLHDLGADDQPLVIQVQARQWWWHFRYLGDPPSEMVDVSNELHLPVGRVVQFELAGMDVIHSFWIPNLHGKKDMIPGRDSRTKLRADRIGVYWAQCAEFCGYQHATMRFPVVVESPEDFEKWRQHQKEPAAEPSTVSQERGKAVFLERTCVMCHTIQGTIAGSRVGPDLTHVASRLKIASGTLPNTRGHLGGWIMDPQQIRPGVRMPANPLSPDELRDVLDYLEILK